MTIQVRLRKEPKHVILADQTLVGGFFEYSYPHAVDVVFVVFPITTRRRFFIDSFFDHKLCFPIGVNAECGQMAAMNVSNAFLGAAPGVAAFNSLASLSGMSCRCRIGVRTTQTLINAKLVTASRLLDGLDAAIASNRLADWTGTAAEEYRTRLDRIARQSALLRDDMIATSRLLWSAGAA